jgi:hypothetical protein
MARATGAEETRNNAVASAVSDLAQGTAALETLVMYLTKCTNALLEMKQKIPPKDQLRMKEDGAREAARKTARETGKETVSVVTAGLKKARTLEMRAEWNVQRLRTWRKMRKSIRKLCPLL